MAIYRTRTIGEEMQLFQLLSKFKIVIYFNQLFRKFKKNFKSDLKGKFTIILFKPDNAEVKQYHVPACCNFILKITAGILLTFSLALISHTLYLANYIKNHETDFAKVDRLESKLITAEMTVEALTKKNTDLTSANLPTIAAFEAEALAALRNQTVGHTSLSRGSNDSRGRALEEIASQDDLSLADHEKLLQLIYDTAVNNAKQLAHIPSILPLKGSTYVTSPYGYRRNPFGGRSSEFHDGVDFAANHGTPIYATADGIVSFAGWDYGYGRKIVINHGNGIITFYGHNSKLLVSAGTRVKKGDKIAYSGNTGRSSGPHLHYGAYVNGKSINPLTFTNK